MNPRTRRYKRRRGWLITDSTSLVPVCSHWLAPLLFCFPRRNTVVSACIQRCPCNFIPHVQLHSAQQNSRQSRWCNKRDPVCFKYDGPRPLWTSFHLFFFYFFHCNCISFRVIMQPFAFIRKIAATKLTASNRNGKR